MSGEQQDSGMAWFNFEIFKCHREYNLNLRPIAYHHKV